MNNEYIYYRSVVSRPLKIYRVSVVTFSNGNKGVSIQRWNWDFENWNGHIHNSEKTRKMIREGIEVVKITEEEKNNLIK